MTSDPPLQEQVNFWDWHWSHEQSRRTKNAWKDRRHGVIIDYLVSLHLERPSILDVGCGSGWYTGDLPDIGPTTGIDLSEVAIGNARRRCPAANFVVGDIVEAELPDGRYDVVLAQEVFDHVDDQRAFLQRVHDLLRPGGYFIASCTNRFVWDRRGARTQPDPVPGHIKKHLTRREFRRMLKPQFEVLDECSIIPMGKNGVLRVVNSPKLNGALSRLIPAGRLERLKERAGLGYQNIALARRRDHTRH